MSKAFANRYNAASKKCCNCYAELPATGQYFYRNSRATDGFQSRCKTCDNGHGPRRAADEHSRPNAEKRARKICMLCANQPWRVEGPRCRNPACGLLYADEPQPELELRRFDDILSRV